ncbi:hypothetical protein HDU96_001313 [Phlyctochytrium bullatum]|nr:hypothetical protein HDU96_001313 [Phlyctochytrium bullatum]
MQAATNAHLEIAFASRVNALVTAATLATIAQTAPVIFGTHPALNALSRRSPDPAPAAEANPAPLPGALAAAGTELARPAAALVARAPQLKGLAKKLKGKKALGKKRKAKGKKAFGKKKKAKGKKGAFGKKKKAKGKKAKGKIAKAIAAAIQAAKAAKAAAPAPATNPAAVIDPVGRIEQSFFAHSFDFVQ